MVGVPPPPVLPLSVCERTKGHVRPAFHRRRGTTFDERDQRLELRVVRGVDPRGHTHRIKLWQGGPVFRPGERGVEGNGADHATEEPVTPVRRLDVAECGTQRFGDVPHHLRDIHLAPVSLCIGGERAHPNDQCLPSRGVQKRGFKGHIRSEFAYGRLRTACYQRIIER